MVERDRVIGWIHLGGVEVEIIGVMKYVPNIGVKLLPYRLFDSVPQLNFQTQHWYAGDGTAERVT